MSRSTIYALKFAGKFPQPIRIGSHAVRWIAAEVDAWDRIQTPCLNWPAQPWWREAPGTKWLVLGNHDVDRVNQVLPVAVDATAMTLFAPGEPPLLLTHVPLLQVAPGCINVHGHVHGEESPTSSRHINVSVEQLNYRPARLSDIRRLALRLLAGRTVPGRCTRERLTVVEGTMP